MSLSLPFIDSSWFSPLHLLIMEYIAPVSVFATICILILNTAQVPPSHKPTSNIVIPSNNLLHHPTKRQNNAIRPSPLGIQHKVYRTTHLSPKTRYRNLNTHVNDPSRLAPLGGRDSRGRDALLWRQWSHVGFLSTEIRARGTYPVETAES